jgi:hypothetical protein
MGLAADVARALERRPDRQHVAGLAFPSVGRSVDDQIHALESAIASLATAVKLIADRLDEPGNGRSV